MHFFRPALCLAALALGPLLSCADMGTYVSFTSPTSGTQWVNGQANALTWTKGLLDDVVMFDLEIARLSQDGLILAALNVPANSGKLNLFLQDVPAADDYYLLFINSTHGGMYAISPRFSILDASSSSSATATAAALTGVSTVSISGGPNPTAEFATTFPAIDSGVTAWRFEGAARSAGLGVICATAAAVLGAAWTVL